jgi:hypothetical protein
MTTILRGIIGWIYPLALIGELKVMVAAHGRTLQRTKQ